MLKKVINPVWLLNVKDDINMKDILVIGESCRDIFIYCDAPRLCPDIPVPVLNITNQTENVDLDGKHTKICKYITYGTYVTG